MATKSQLELAEQIKVAIADHIVGREDSHGFSRLDALLGKVEDLGSAGQGPVEQALLSIISGLDKEIPASWEAVRMIVAASHLKSAAIAGAVIKILDQFKEPRNPMARFQAFLAYREAGGILTRPRLEKETALRDELRPQWVDLVLSAYLGAPENIISFIEEQVSDNKGTFTWEDVRKRLPLIFKWLGSDFNRGIVRITAANGAK